MIQGTIIRVAGPVVDVKFTGGKLPALQEALTVTAEGTERTMEVAQHVDETTVRCIMLSASEGLGKGMEVTATGHGLNAPVGEGTLGRMFDPLGRPIDGKGPVDDLPHWPIHRKAPSFAEQKPATEILETRSTSSPPPKIPSAGPSTARPPLLTSRNPQLKFWRPASRSSTCWLLTPRAARSACSAVPVSARPC